MAFCNNSACWYFGVDPCALARSITNSGIRILGHTQITLKLRSNYAMYSYSEEINSPNVFRALRMVSPSTAPQLSRMYLISKSAANDAP
jgi:hypothetical protein